MTLYASAIILTELLMVAMILHVVRYSGFTKQQKFWFIMTFASIMFCAGAEFAVHSGHYQPNFAIPLTILTVLQFSVAPLLGVFFSGALGLYKQAKIATFIFSFNLLVEIALAPFKLVFYFNNDGYSRGKLFFIYSIFFFASLIYLIVSMLIAGKKFIHRDTWTIFMILVIIIAGIIPMAIFRINITYVAIAIAACLCYIFYNDLVQQDIQEEVKEKQQKLNDLLNHVIFGLANLIENRDLETGQHVNRSSKYTKMLSEFCLKEGVYTDEIDQNFINLIYNISPLHDIGKIVVSDVILKKPGRLNEIEFEQMKKHVSEGERIARQVLDGVAEEKYINFACDIIAYHHERWDGKGYSKGLKGEEIPLCARIMAIADVFDALVSKRSYKEAMPVEEALKIIKEGSGRHFDPQLVDVFLKHSDDFIKEL